MIITLNDFTHTTKQYAEDTLKGIQDYYAFEAKILEEQAKKGYFNSYVREELDKFKKGINEKLDTLYAELNNSFEVVLETEQLLLKQIKNKPIDNFSELEILRRLDYSKKENVDHFKRFVNKYKGNSLALTYLKQINEESEAIFFYSEPEDIEDVLNKYMEKLETYIRALYNMDTTKYLPVLEMTINGYINSIDKDYKYYEEYKDELK